MLVMLVAAGGCGEAGEFADGRKKSSKVSCSSGGGVPA